MNPLIDPDDLLTRLKDLTRAFSQKAEETRTYFLNAASSSVHSPVSPPPANANTPGQRMIFLPSGNVQNGPNGSVTDEQRHPRFVQFPLEFAFLEIFLSYSLGSLDTELRGIEDDVNGATARFFADHPKGDTLHKLHTLKEPLESYADKIELLSNTFEELLNSNEDLYNMELTRLYYRPDCYDAEAEELNPNLEIMLEFFDQEIDQLKRRAGKVIISPSGPHQCSSLLSLSGQSSMLSVTSI